MIENYFIEFLDFTIGLLALIRIPSWKRWRSNISFRNYLLALIIYEFINFYIRT